MNFFEYIRFFSDILLNFKRIEMNLTVFLFFFSFFIIKSSSWDVEICESTHVTNGYLLPLPDLVYSIIENYTVVELESESGAKCLDGHKL